MNWSEMAYLNDNLSLSEVELAGSSIVSGDCSHLKSLSLVSSFVSNHPVWLSTCPTGTSYWRPETRASFQPWTLPCEGGPWPRVLGCLRPLAPAVTLL
jgi:hypothetical protein